jgi:hypothetical protein
MRKADNLTTSCAVVMKSGNINFLEPSGPLQACNGTALPLPLPLPFSCTNLVEYYSVPICAGVCFFSPVIFSEPIRSVILYPATDPNKSCIYDVSFLL